MPVKGISNNPAGRPKGIVNSRVQQWNELSGSIMGLHTERFNECLCRLWSSNDPQDNLKAAQLYLQVLEYFKPKQSRISHEGRQNEPVIIVIPDKI
jgi:hypothetical protein